MSLTDLKSVCQHSCVFFQRLQGKILFLAFSNFQRLPTFLGSKPAMTKLSIHCITMTLTLLPPSFTYGICTITLAHADIPGKSHPKLSCLTILDSVGRTQTLLGIHYSVYHLMSRTCGEKMTQLFIPHLSNCRREEGQDHGIVEVILMQSQSAAPHISMYSWVLILMTPW